MNFFFDNNLSPHLAKAIHALAEPDGHTVIHLRKRFKPSTPDIEWIEELGSESGWIIISGDIRITKNRHEKEAWLEAKLTTFFLTKSWLNHSYWDQAWHLVRWWPHIIRQAEMIYPGAGFEMAIKSVGKFKQIDLK